MKIHCDYWFAGCEGKNAPVFAAFVDYLNLSIQNLPTRKNNFR